MLVIASVNAPNKQHGSCGPIRPLVGRDRAHNHSGMDYSFWPGQFSPEQFSPELLSPKQQGASP